MAIFGGTSTQFAPPQEPRESGRGGPRPSALLMRERAHCRIVGVDEVKVRKLRGYDLFVSENYDRQGEGDLPAKRKRVDVEWHNLPKARKEVRSNERGGSTGPGARGPVQWFGPNGLGICFLASHRADGKAQVS